MRRQIFSLSLLATSMLMANNDCGCCSSCEPCCTLEPKKCIDCECYTPQYYDLQCDWGFFASVDFLYWYARENNLSYALKVFAEPLTTPNGGIASPDIITVARRYEILDAYWCPGFRVGLGWNSCCDGWDLSAQWTYYHNEAFNETQVPLFGAEVPTDGEFGLLNPWTNALAFGQPFFDYVSAKWKVYLNYVDLVLGRKYWLSNCFTLRPYAGARGMWSRTKYNVIGDFGPVDFAVQFTDVIGISKDKFSSRNWGVGMVIGLQPTWYFTKCFALFGNFDSSFGWGEFKSKKDEDYFNQFNDNGVPTVGNNLFNESVYELYRMQMMFDLGIGLRWEDTWCCNRYRTSLDVGWEHHIWINHNFRNKYSDYDSMVGETSHFHTYSEIASDFVYGGLVIQGRFDF